MTEPVDRAESARYRRFAAKYQLSYSCRPVAWEELPVRQRTPAPGPQHFIAMLARVVDRRPVALQWPLVQVHGSRSRRPPSLAVALAELRDGIIGTSDRRDHGECKHPEDFVELERIEAGLIHMLGEAGLEEFLDLGVAEFIAAWHLDWE